MKKETTQKVKTRATTHSRTAAGWGRPPKLQAIKAAARATRKRGLG